MAGDSILAIFETAIGAVDAAIAIQAAIERLAEDAPPERRMRYRIGVHLGDIIEKPDGTAYGDGINVAARIQSLAEPGDVLVSLAIRARCATGLQPHSRTRASTTLRTSPSRFEPFASSHQPDRPLRRVGVSRRGL